MLVFLGLCLVSRIAYSFNDVFTGALARRYGGVEVAAFRGISLGLTMAPWLLWVPVRAWGELGGQLGDLLLLVAITAALNLLQFRAARYLPFGLRAAFIVSGVALGGVVLGITVLGERTGGAEIGWSLLIVTSAVLAALGNHSSAEQHFDIPRGAAYALGSAVLMAVAGLWLARLSRATHPLLVAWAWEFGAGLCLVVPLALRLKESAARDVARRFGRIALGSLPTVLGSGASALALTRGPLGLWAALAGTQAIVTAALGARLHHEKMGPRRWFCVALGSAGVCGLALARD